MADAGDKVWLIADMVGAVRLYAVLPEPEIPGAEARYRSEMERAVNMFAGQVIEVAGDELLAEFELADDAWCAAREIQVKIGALSPIAGLRLASRCGLHRGPATNANLAEAGKLGAAMLAVRAGGGQVLASPAFVAALNGPVVAMPLEGEVMPGLLGQLLAWHPEAKAVVGSAQVSPSASTKAAAPCGFRVRLTVNGDCYEMDGQKSRELRVGRDPASDVLITDRRASRQHARLLCRGNEVVYVDRSTNGSFVLQGRQERFIRNEEIVLRESGKICFGGSANDPAAVCIVFELGSRL